MVSPFVAGSNPAQHKEFCGSEEPCALFDVLGFVLYAIAVVRLLAVFPFGFSYFADVLPTFLRLLP